MDGLILPKSPGADCQNCTLRAEAFVPPAGPAQPQLVVVGEAPGADEVRVGEPFVGKSGQLLQAMLKQVGQEWRGAGVPTWCCAGLRRTEPPPSWSRSAVHLGSLRSWSNWESPYHWWP